MLRMAVDGLPEGWFSPTEIQEFRRVVQSIRGGRVIEIGAWYGRSTASITNICRDNQTALTVVDTWRGSPSDFTRDLASLGPDPFEVFRANLTSLGLWDLVDAWRMTSAEAAMRVADESADVILLDADHAYESVREDLALWWPKLKPGGTFLGHDYRPQYPGVARAVEEHVQTYCLTPPAVTDSLWRLTKPLTMPLSRDFRVAVVTPMYRTDPLWLEQCCRSVAEQTYPCKHYVICDGEGPLEVAQRHGAETLRIPGPCQDFGDAARSVGSMLAVAQGCDFLAWLDADNWYEADHIERLLRLQQQTQADVITAGRSLYAPDGRRLGDCYEVNGETFADTSCYLIARTAFTLAGIWGAIPRSLHPLGDRVMWEFARRPPLRHAHSSARTVAYRTNYRCHFEYFGELPPANSKPSVTLSPEMQAELERFTTGVAPAVRPADAAKNARCVVIVPHQGNIHSETEAALRELEQRGYAVWRRSGYSAIDQGRCQLATDALAEGFDETMWIDSDIGFNPDDVDRLRDHRLPISCALYPQKGRQALAAFLKEGTTEVNFGVGGELIEVRYTGAGFLHVRREVYDSVERHLQLPTCNLRFGRKMLPFFLPLVIREKWAPDSMQPGAPDSYWYLAEDFAFCERVRRSGFKILADNGIRLFHFGNYGYSWEDAGGTKERFGQYRFQITGSTPET